MKEFTLAEACDRIEIVVKSLYTRTCLEGCRCSHRSDLSREVQPRTIKREEVEQHVAYIRMIRWNTSWVKYPPTLERDLVVLVLSCIDSFDRAGYTRRDWDREFQGGSIINNSALLKEWNENLEQALSALEILVQNMKRRFARAHINEEELPEKALTDQPQAELVKRLSAEGLPIQSTEDHVQGIIQELRYEIRRLKAEVESLGAASGDTTSLDDSSSRIVLKRFLNEPINPKNSVVRPRKLHKRFRTESIVTTSSAMNEGMSQIPSPPYELSENGRRRYLDTQRDEQTDDMAGPSTIQPRQ